MELIKKLFSKGITDVVDSVGNVIDRFTLSKEEKMEFKLEMQSRLMKMESELEETYRYFENADASAIPQLRMAANQIKQETLQALLQEINKGGAVAKTTGRRR